MGIADKSIRFIIAIVFIILFATKTIPNSVWWSYALLVLAGFFIVTSLLGSCPLYLPFKIDTRSHEKKKEDKKKNSSGISSEY